MVQSAARTVAAYLAELPAERRAIVARVRAVVRKHLPRGYVESMAYGMIGWGVPLKRYPDTYNGQPLSYAALAAQKNGYSLYLMCLYGDGQLEKSLREAFRRIGSKPDIGKCCIRFRRVEDLPLEAIGALVASLSVEEFVAMHEKSRPGRK